METADEYQRDVIKVFSPEVVFAGKVLYQDATRWKLT